MKIRSDEKLAVIHCGHNRLIKCHFWKLGVAAVSSLHGAETGKSEAP